MTVFVYKATDQNGQFVEGNLEAPNYHVAVKKIQKLNYFPIKVTEGKSGNGFSLANMLSWPDFFGQISQKELLTFTQQLSTLVGAGITLDDSLSSLAKLAEKDNLKEILADIQKRVHSGSSFAEALAEHPKTFSKLYVNMIRAGEEGGVLTESLNRLGRFMEKAEDLKNNIRAAMAYPIVLALVGGSAVIILFTVVIPRFSTLFEDMGEALPLPTKIMLGMSALVSNYWWLLLILFILMTAGFISYKNTEQGKYRWDFLVLKLPLFGTLVQKIEVSRFSLTLSTLLKSGVPVLHALGIVKTILSNRIIINAMSSLQEGLKSGKGFSGPLQKSNIFPPMAVHMITVGETSGTLDDMLTKVSETYDKEVELSIKQLISLLEPMMILLMALIIGFIVISMLLAIFSINDISF
jgi:general secretion pathway protein F